MLGVIYLIISGMIGYEITKILLESRESRMEENRIWLILPASFGVGTPGASAFPAAQPPH